MSFFCIAFYLIHLVIVLHNLLGAENLWNILLAGPFVAALISSGLLFFLPETPKAILLANKANGQEEARKSTILVMGSFFK